MGRRGRDTVGMRGTTRLSFAFFVGVLASIAAYGLLSVLRPSQQPAPVITLHSVVTQPSVTTTATSLTLRPRLDALRTGLAETEAQIDQLQLQSLTTSTSMPAASEAAEPAQSLALQNATERRDIALRHAKAIRDALAAKLPVTALAGVRESAVVGQLLAAMGPVDDEIAKQSALLRPTHPTMLALTARKTALEIQVNTAAADVASALEADAKAEDASIAAHTAKASSPTPAAQPTNATADTAATDLHRLQLAAASQRAELDTLLTTEAPAATVTPAAPTVTTTTLPAAAPASPQLPLTNLLIAAGAGVVALLAQMLITRRGPVSPPPSQSDLEAWRTDSETAPAPLAPTLKAEPQLRQAS